MYRSRYSFHSIRPSQLLVGSCRSLGFKDLGHSVDFQAARAKARCGSRGDQEPPACMHAAIIGERSTIMEGVAHRWPHQFSHRQHMVSMTHTDRNGFTTIRRVMPEVFPHHIICICSFKTAGSTPAGFLSWTAQDKF